MSIEDLTQTQVRKICMACSREFAGAGGVCPHDGNALVALPQDPYIGRRIADKYQVLSVLGTGGMGIVYLARHETMQSNVAIKMLRAQFVGDSSSVKRFNHEAIATRRLSHPNVITTYDHGLTPQGQPYIVMEVLQGKSLADEIKKLKQISVDRVIHIFSQACDAIEHAHKQGILHRDLKPGNIMLIDFNEDPDFVKVVDFGVAKFMPTPQAANVEIQSLTQAGEVCGSPVYMSPEQCLGQDLDRRADVYSMGVVLYEALTGKLPLLGKNMMETMSKHINLAPPSFKEVRPDLYIPEKIEQAVMRALSKQPDARQPNMAMLKQELQFAVPRPGQNVSLRTIATGAVLPPAEEAEKKPAWLIPAIAAGASAIIVGGAAWFFIGHKPANDNVPMGQGGIVPGGSVSRPAVLPNQKTIQPEQTPAASVNGAGSSQGVITPVSVGDVAPPNPPRRIEPVSPPSADEKMQQTPKFRKVKTANHASAESRKTSKAHKPANLSKHGKSGDPFEILKEMYSPSRR